MRLTTLGSLVSLVVSLDVIGLAPDVPNHGQPLSEVTVIEHTFASSWGSPAAIQYLTPSFDFTHVQMEIDLSSSGNQYDRLAHIYLNNVEVWRPSTPEPASKNINTVMSKDVSQYAALFRESGTLTFQLDNNVDASLNGVFQCSLKLRFYKTQNVDTTESQWYYSDAPPSNITALQSGTLATSPPNLGASIPQVSRNTYRLGMIVYASGNADEEFYYTNGEGSSGPTRLIQVYVNSQLAGIIDPFQPVYTGGIEPYLWTPIVGVNAFDVPSYYVDLSTWLPSLWDKQGSVEIKISNGYSGNGIGNNWLMNAALVEWSDSNVHATSGTQAQVSQGNFQPTYVSEEASQAHIGYVGIHNSIHLRAQLQFSDGSTRTVDWQQDSVARNAQFLGGDGTKFYIGYQHGTSIYSDSTGLSFGRTHEYPIGIYMKDSGTTIDHSYIISNNGANGVTSVNNNVRAGWGGGGADGTSAVCAWVDKGVPSSRSAQSQNGQEASQGQRSGFSGSWASISNNLDSLASRNDSTGLHDLMAQLSTGYASRSTDALNAREISQVIEPSTLISRNLPFRCPPQLCGPKN